MNFLQIENMDSVISDIMHKREYFLLIKLY